MIDKEANTKDETIGFHKGCISTLAKEREELLKMVNVVEQILNAHINALNDLGVKITNNKDEKKRKNINIDNLL